MSEVSQALADQLVDELAPMGPVVTKSMFGGNGIFLDKVMFMMVDRSGTAYMRTDQSTASDFEAAGSSQFKPMPYWSIPEEVAADPEELLAWAGRALEVARAAKK